MRPIWIFWRLTILSRAKIVRIRPASSDANSYLVVGHTSSPRITIYNTSDWSKVSDPVTLPAGNAIGVAFSP